ncbi:MAG TPA: YwbE family protein [Thermoanaerobaculia bacterium]|nr:YwbE family protein [Thermoanaerobaculia bacterium]HSK79202.1 YwbE family protein [Thermoanaerobaculia bacterium]
MTGESRKDIHPGLSVEIVQKQDQRTGKRTRGIVRDILTSSPHHPHGIKVRLQSGEVGRVKSIGKPEPLQRPEPPRGEES